MKRHCTICQELGEVKYLNLFTVGSEGTLVCNSCEMALIEFIRAMITIAGRGRKIGYQNAKDVRKSKDKQIKLSEKLEKKVKELEKKLQCNCDLDNWQPETDTGHSWVCRINKQAKVWLKESL